MDLHILGIDVSTTAVRDAMESLISHLEEQLKQTEELIRKQINNHLPLRAGRELLLSILAWAKRPLRG